MLLAWCASSQASNKKPIIQSYQAAYAKALCAGMRVHDVAPGYKFTNWSCRPYKNEPTAGGWTYSVWVTENHDKIITRWYMIVLDDGTPIAVQKLGAHAGTHSTGGLKA